MRRTRIVCTLGPATNRPEMVRGLIARGMDVARLNFSHGTHEDHRRSCELVREAAAEAQRHVAVLMDLKGPKMRTGKLEGGGPVELVEGVEVTITTEQIPGTAKRLSTTYKALADDVNAGETILLADGLLQLRVLDVAPPEVHCRVIVGGELGEHKGINLPGTDVSAPALTEKDFEDLRFGLDLGVDMVALSFVRKADDLKRARRFMEDHGRTVPLVAKIERPEAVDRFRAIAEEADAIMVARGDLGVELPYQEVPSIQKGLVEQCNLRGLPVIVATQMLESMMDNPRATRAEVMDVANAIYDGADAVMLSGETAVGRYPAKAVEVMATIAERTDDQLRRRGGRPAIRNRPVSCPIGGSYDDAIGLAAADMADSLDIKRLLCFTKTGHTARAIAKYRPRVPIVAITYSEATCRRCALVWGVERAVQVAVEEVDELLRAVDRLLLEHGLAGEDDAVIVVAGTPLGAGGTTNLLEVHRVGSAG